MDDGNKTSCVIPSQNNVQHKSTIHRQAVVIEGTLEISTKVTLGINQLALFL